MPINQQQSSILTEPELRLLASQFNKPKDIYFSVYSFQLPLKFANGLLSRAETVEQLILMLSASQRGSALVLPDYIESASSLDKLLQLLNRRADIQIFWVGKMPSMDIALPCFEHCPNRANLLTEVNRWQQRCNYNFRQWLQEYRVAFITKNRTKNSKLHSQLEKIGLQQIEYFDAKSTASEINNKQLLVIDLCITGLRFIDLLNNLANREAFPILILFGKLPANLCRAAYNVARNKGFSILASLTSAPNPKKWQHLLHSLYLKVYLKHWITPQQTEKMAYGVYNLNNQHLESYFCLYGMSKTQIAQLSKRGVVRKIISAQSILDWFPDGIRREIRNELGRALNCKLKQIDICIEDADQIPTTSVLYAALVMARLFKFKVYWLLKDETQLSTDTLKNYPISDIIFCEKISHHLITEPSNELLNFIKQAKQEKIRLGATLQQTQAVTDALSLYGIEFVLNQQQSLS